MTSRVDYCNVILTGAPRCITDNLQRALNVAARVASSVIPVNENENENSR